jgi:hypothetical protein
MLDDLFRKTKATPYIYWLPLTEEQVSFFSSTLDLKFLIYSSYFDTYSIWRKKGNEKSAWKREDCAKLKERNASKPNWQMQNRKMANVPTAALGTLRQSEETEWQ